MSKFRTANEAVGLIKDGDTVTLCGIFGLMTPAAVLRAIPAWPRN